MITMRGVVCDACRGRPPAAGAVVFLRKRGGIPRVFCGADHARAYLELADQRGLDPRTRREIACLALCHEVVARLARRGFAAQAGHSSVWVDGPARATYLIGGTHRERLTAEEVAWEITGIEDRDAIEATSERALLADIAADARGGWA